MTPDLSPELQLELGLRLAAGLVLGAVIGFERELHRQPAGFRTHSLVALGAALFTVVSAYGFVIGFIGAGTILQHRGSVRGLTTAASLWAVAAIGTAAGAGLLVMAVVGTLLILIVLALLDQMEEFLKRRLNLPVPEPKPGEDPDEGRTEDLS